MLPSELAAVKRRDRPNCHCGPPADHSDGSADLFEIGLFNPDAGPTESVMIPRVWDAETILKSVAWLRHQNRHGRNIYIRPKGEHHLSLVDDLTRMRVSAMKEEGFNPAVIVETSPGNFQAWLKHPERLEQRSGHGSRASVGGEVRR